MPRIQPNWYMAGARAGSRKRWWELRMAITSPLKPKMTELMTCTRSRPAVRAMASGVKPGARI